MDFITQNKIILVVIILVVLTLGVGYLIYKRKEDFIENYGGPIKNVQKLPKGVCENICRQYLQQCNNQPSIQISGDYGFCMNQYNLCAAECHYSNHQRM